MDLTTPQPKTFAPSREDVLTTLAYFFGSPVSPEKLKDYSEHHAQARRDDPKRTARAAPSRGLC